MPIMRYRLRTLLIVISLLAAVLARVAYLKRQQDFHRHEVKRLVTQLAAFHHYDWREIEQSISDAGAEGPFARGSWIGGYPSGQYGSPENEYSVATWHLARQQEYTRQSLQPGHLSSVGVGLGRSKQRP